MINYYKVLGVHRGSGSDDVRDAYRPLAAATHPDKVPGKEEQFMLYAKAKIALIKERAHYDAKLAALGVKCARCSGTGTRSKISHWSHAVVVPCAVCDGCGFTGLPAEE